MVDIQTVQQLLVTASWATPLVTALVQVIKTTTRIDTRFVPLIAVLVGLVLGFLIAGFTATAGLAGIIFGLSSMGLYKLGTKTFEDR